MKNGWWVAALALGCSPGGAASDGGADANTADASTADTAGTTRTAEVLWWQGPGGGAGYGSANFFDQGDVSYLEQGFGPTPYSCTRSVQGPCVVYTCVDAPLQGSARLAGALTLARAGGNSVTLQAGTGGSFSYPGGAPSASVTWNAGESVLVSAAGSAEVPAFMGTVSMPASTTLMDPSNNTTAPRAADLRVSWSAFSPGDAVLTLASSARASSPVVCTFSGSAGSGAIPAAALAGLAAGAANLSLSSRAAQTVVTGTWAVSLVAMANAVNQSRTLTLQ